MTVVAPITETAVIAILLEATVVAVVIIPVVIEFVVVLKVVVLGMPTPVLQKCCASGNLWFLEFHACIDAIWATVIITRMTHAETNNFWWSNSVKGLVHASEEEFSKFLTSCSGRNVSNINHAG